MNILYVNSLEANNKELARQLASANVLIAEQNKLAKERQEWALHTNEVIRSLNQQLSAALAACKLKDEAISDFLKQYPHMTKGYVLDALAIQPDDDALKAWIGEPVAWLEGNPEGLWFVAYSKNDKAPQKPLYSPKGLK